MCPRRPDFWRWPSGKVIDRNVVGIMNGMNEAERRFAAYLDANGYAWQLEPDYRVELDLDEAPATKPDFLIARGVDRGICEVRQFESSRIHDALGAARGLSFIDPKTVFGALRSGIREKSEQLGPYKGLGIALIIVIANALGADVMLDDRHLPAAMFGNPAFRLAVDPASESMAEATSIGLALENYGVFRSPVRNGNRIVGRENRFPFVSAVAVVHERQRSADWRDEILRSVAVADASLEAAIEAALRATKIVEARVAAGEEPRGSYQWVDLYEVDGDDAAAVPTAWFDAERDRRYGFLDDSGYGLISERT